MAYPPYAVHHPLAHHMDPGFIMGNHEARISDLETWREEEEEKREADSQKREIRRETLRQYVRRGALIAILWTIAQLMIAFPPESFVAHVGHAIKDQLLEPRVLQ